MLDAPPAKTGVIISEEDQLSWAFKLHAFYGLLLLLASLMGQMVKNPPGFDPWVGKISWRTAEHPHEDSCLENPHGQRSLLDYSRWGRKQWDTNE